MSEPETPQRVLLAGAGGQVGRELQQACPEGVELYALTRQELDISDAVAVGEAVGEVAPEVVINAAAYTKVDQAESEEDAAFAVNAAGARNMAVASRSAGARLVHLSTDFVFDGAAARPYRAEDPTRPLSVYGRTKLAGEREVREAHGNDTVIVRSSWIYSRFGSNFVKTMLRLMSDRPQLAVVSDQIGSPTWAAQLAKAVWEIAARDDIPGIVNWCDAGRASWFDFAVAIQEIACELGLLSASIPIEPIPTEAYPTAAVRPPFSVLETSETAVRLSTPQLDWPVALRRMLEQVAAEEASARP